MRTNPKCQCRCLGRRAVRSERRDDLFQKFVVEIILRPAWNLLGLYLLPELQRCQALGDIDNEELTFMMKDCD